MLRVMQTCPSKTRKPERVGDCITESPIYDRCKQCDSRAVRTTIGRILRSMNSIIVRVESIVKGLYRLIVGLSENTQRVGALTVLLTGFDLTGLSLCALSRFCGLTNFEMNACTEPTKLEKGAFMTDVRCDLSIEVFSNLHEFAKLKRTPNP